MDNKTFHALLDRRIERTLATLATKGDEYGQQDRLHNFKLAAKINQVPPVEAAWGMASKHLVSVLDLIYGRQEATQANIDEKIGDLINYLILIEALFTEQMPMRVEKLDTPLPPLPGMRHGGSL